MDRVSERSFLEEDEKSSDIHAQSLPAIVEINLQGESIAFGSSIGWANSESF